MLVRKLDQTGLHWFAARSLDWFARAQKRYGDFANAEAAYEALRPYARTTRTKRYAQIYVGGHGQKQVAFHRLVTAYGVRRALRRSEPVHHRDGNPRNNHPSNLQLCASPQEHDLEHGRVGLTVRGRDGRKVPLARRVMEIFLGRRLRDDEVIQRRNGDRRDNRPSNLLVIRRAELNARMGRLYGRDAVKKKQEKRRQAERARWQQLGLSDELWRKSCGGAGGQVVRRADPQGHAGSHASP